MHISWYVVWILTHKFWKFGSNACYLCRNTYFSRWFFYWHAMYISSSAYATSMTFVCLSVTSVNCDHKNEKGKSAHDQTNGVLAICVFLEADPDRILWSRSVQQLASRAISASSWASWLLYGGQMHTSCFKFRVSIFFEITCTENYF